jgi:epoxyqueuosine reductase
VAYLKQVLDKATSIRKLVKNNSNGQMTYMENHFDKRLNPTLLVDGAKVSSPLLNYYPEQLQNSDTFKISKYAYGADYHFVIKEKLKEFCFLFSPPEVSGRAL